MQSRKTLFLLLALTAAGVAPAAEPEGQPASPAPKDQPAAAKMEKEQPPMEKPKLSEGVYAKFETSLGDFTARLYADRAPKTVQNFIELAEGKKAHMDPATGQTAKTRLYDNRKIFRVLKGFMFQTGSGSDSASYSPGFTIPDEFLPDLKFTKPGLFAMANTGRADSGGCQFFVTFAPASFLDGKYTIFGEMTEGMETVRKIEAVPVRLNPQMGESSLPIEMPLIKKTTILRIGKDDRPLEAEPKEPAKKQ